MQKFIKKKKFIAIGKYSNIEILCRRYSNGEIPICPKCKRDLLVALTWKEANKLNIHPGIFCSYDNSHFQITLNIIDSN